MKFLSIDEEGYFLSQGIRWTDENLGETLLKNLRRTKNNAWVTSQTADQTQDFYYVEAFDQPLVALRIDNSKDFIWTLQTPYGFQTQFDIQKLYVDEWDRFLGFTVNDVPFVLSRAAQDQFFKFLGEFDDESFTVNKVKITPPPWPVDNETLNAQVWDQVYTEERTGWDFGEAHPSLPSISAQLKLNRCRVLVLGCGKGHDAAFFARQGHFVTAVDWSNEALKHAQQLYGTISNLTFVNADVLNMPKKMDDKFDLIFEHACYCAIPTNRRNDLVKSWKRALADQGQLLAIFPVPDKTGGPPFASSEWELRQRLKKDFHFLYWSRSRITSTNRIGRELIVFAKRAKS